MSQVCNSMALLSSAKEVIKEILKMKSDIQRQVIVLLYIWWYERCAIRNGSNSHGIGFGYHI
jgi:hypothetical protein